MPRGDFTRAPRDTAGGVVAPIAWETLGEDGEVVVRNGTAFFLDAGEGPFVVTADHVFQGYLDAKELYPESVCRLLGFEFDPVDRLIARSSSYGVDIATFRIAEHEIRRLGKAVITGCQPSWPPDPPQEGKGVFFAGYPGDDRLTEGSGGIDFGCFVGLLTARSVSDRQVLCTIKEGNLIDTPHGEAAARPDHDVRGISGAPLLTPVEAQGLALWRLVGVIHKGQGRTIFAARADHIRPDGTLRPLD